MAGCPRAHRLIRADGVHLGPEHDGRENEEEQPLSSPGTQQAVKMMLMILIIIIINNY